jgi:hypothetical protein
MLQLLLLILLKQIFINIGARTLQSKTFETGIFTHTRTAIQKPNVRGNNWDYWDYYIGLSKNVGDVHENRLIEYCGVQPKGRNI